MSAQPITDAWDDLDEFLSTVEPIDLGGDVDQADKADRLLRHVLRHRRQLAADEAVAAAQIEQVQSWLEGRRAAHDTSYVEAMLANYHEARLQHDPKAKTIHLPSGVLTARKQPDRWDFDDAAFVEWATQRRTDLLRTKIEVDRPAAKKALIVSDDGRVLDFDSGEFVECVRVIPGAVTFAVKPQEDDQ